MAGAKDIVAVSIPFTIGVVVAALLPAGRESCFAAALVCSLCTGALCVLSCLTRIAVPTIPILYFFIGAAYYCTSGLPEANGGGMHHTSTSLDKLCSLIESIGYRHKETEALVEALMTGRRQGLTPEMAGWFRKSGASHILALSGLHLGVIYAIISKILGALGNGRAAKCTRSISVITLSGIYAIITGASPSIIRAFLFITLGELSGLLHGRKKRPICILCAALMIQLAINPRMICSPGFQLSYLAMLGIFIIFPWLKDFYPHRHRTDITGRIWNSAAMSISCQIFTAPAVWWHFRTFPQYFILTNLLALPLTEMLMVISVFTIGLDAIGICPTLLIDLNDGIAITLLQCLRIISSL